MRTSEAVTGARGIPIGYGTLALLYLGLVFIAVLVLKSLSRAPETSNVRELAEITSQGENHAK
jgi:cytochrome d ubiquinol oxidase subunit I